MLPMEAAPVVYRLPKNVATPERESKHSPIFSRLSVGTSSDGHYENVSVSRGPWPLILTAVRVSNLSSAVGSHIVLSKVWIGKRDHLAPPASDRIWACGHLTPDTVAEARYPIPIPVMRNWHLPSCRPELSCTMRGDMCCVRKEQRWHTRLL